MGHRNGNFAVFATVECTGSGRDGIDGCVLTGGAKRSQRLCALTHEVGGTLLCLNDAVLDAAVQPVVAQ
jgi:hypothetical protein